MAYCNKCGKQLAEDAAYCSACGASVAVGQRRKRPANRKREEVWEGNTHKCPECGQPIPSLIEKCPNCGHEFRDVDAVTSARELSDRLDAIEASRPLEGKRKRGGSNQQEISSTDERKISLIRSFPIPNTKEDLTEFLILALSNCSLRIDKYGDEEGTEAEKAIASAWETKLNQAFNKAEVLFGDEPEFEQLKEMRKKRRDEIEQKKAKGRRYFAEFMLATLVVLFVIILFDLFIIKVVQ